MAKLFIDLKDIDVVDGNYDIENIDLEISYDEWQIDSDKIIIKLSETKHLLHTPTDKYNSKYK